MNIILNNELIILLLSALFILSIIFSAYLLKPIDILPVQIKQRNSALDGLRGLLALSVLTHHFYITYTWKTGIGWVAPDIQFLNNLGTIAVSFFFLITGFLFISKIKNSQQPTANSQQPTANSQQPTANSQQPTYFKWKPFYLSRIKRIFPLYIFTIIIVTLISTQLLPYKTEELIPFLWQWFKFESGILNNTNTGIIISFVHWTLLFEWGFYLLVPFVYMLWHRKYKQPILPIILCLVLIVYIISKTDPNNYKLYLLFFLSIPSIIFEKTIKSFIEKYRLLTHFIVILLLSFSFYFTQGYSYLQMCLTATIFSFIANGYDFGGLLLTKTLKKLGEISFSIYLLHGIILFSLFSMFNFYDFSQKNLMKYMLYLPITVMITVLISTYSYIYIEKPFLYKNKNQSSSV